MSGGLYAKESKGVDGYLSSVPLAVGDIVLLESHGLLCSFSIRSYDRKEKAIRYASCVYPNDIRHQIVEITESTVRSMEPLGYPIDVGGDKCFWKPIPQKDDLGKIVFPEKYEPNVYYGGAYSEEKMKTALTKYTFWKHRKIVNPRKFLNDQNDPLEEAVQRAMEKKALAEKKFQEYEARFLAGSDFERNESESISEEEHPGKGPVAYPPPEKPSESVPEAPGNTMDQEGQAVQRLDEGKTERETTEK